MGDVRMKAPGNHNRNRIPGKEIGPGILVRCVFRDDDSCHAFDPSLADNVQAVSEPSSAQVFPWIFLMLLAMLSTSFDSFGQLCNGSLGDPVVNITFDRDNTSSYVPVGSYTYIASSCPNDGYYTLTNRTSGCYGGTWLTVDADHTGNGKFMLVNASYDPGDFFVTQVKDLCPSTTYQFAAWLLNVFFVSGIRPNVTFQVESLTGTVLGKYSTGDIPTTPVATWKEYGFYFTTPSDNPVIVLRMTNNAPGGFGNDLALDDITFRPCGPPISAAIQDHADTVDVCAGNTDAYTLIANVSPDFIDPIYQWQTSTDTGRTWTNIPNANGLTYQRPPNPEAASYWYRLSVAERSLVDIISCRTASNAVVVGVHAPPTVDAGPDMTIIGDVPVTLRGSVSGELPTYWWTPPQYLSKDSILRPVATPPSNTTYTLAATSIYGCDAADQTVVRVVDDLYIPTAFTPNGDGNNDNWRIPDLSPAFEASVRVYNRLGQVVYQTEGASVNWDGRFKGQPQPSGAYVYYVHFKSVYPDKKGTLILIR